MCVCVCVCVIKFKVSHVCYVFADDDQGGYG